MTFADRPWEERFASMGDSAEQKFVEHVDGRCERWGLQRPNLHVPNLPVRVRAAPDYVTNDGFVECMGIGRKQVLQLKLEKWGVLHYWHHLWPVSVWVWDSHKKRSCLISLSALDRVVHTPGLVDIDYFDERKLVLVIPAEAVFEAADAP